MRAETEKKLNEAIDLVNAGMTIKSACERTGISMATYQKCKHLVKQDKKDGGKKDLFMVSLPSHGLQSDAGMLAKLQAENAALRRFIKDFL